MHPIIENLETRKYQSSDVAVVSLTTDLPATVMSTSPGKNKPAHATVTLASVGDTIPRSDKSPVELTVGLYDDGGMLIAMLGSTTLKANAADKKPIKLKLLRPTTLPEGVFNVEARVDASAAGDVNAANDRATAGTVTVTSASADLSLAASTGLTGFVPGGSLAFLTYSLTNGGNVAVKGKASVAIYAIFENGAESLLGTARNVRFEMNPGATYSPTKLLAFRVPASGSIDIPVSLQARLSTDLAFPDAPENNLAAAGSFVIPARSHTTNGGGGGGDDNGGDPDYTPAMFERAGIARTISFNDTTYETSFGMTLEIGEFLDTNATVGMYSFVRPKKQFTLSIGDDSDDSVAGTLKYNGKLGGRAITFGVPRKGADGTAVLVDGEKCYFKFIV